MTALGIVGAAGLALVGWRWWLAFLVERDVRRHAWRTELVSLRAQALKADAVNELQERVRRLELKGLTR